MTCYPRSLKTRVGEISMLGTWGDKQRKAAQAYHLSQIVTCACGCQRAWSILRSRNLSSNTKLGSRQNVQRSHLSDEHHDTIHSHGWRRRYMWMKGGLPACKR